ncbi:unnamed protein product, partial [Brachionus calyciflorus]
NFSLKKIKEMPALHKGMGKILEGILKYQKTIQSELLPLFREILDKPAPKMAIVTGTDSRIVASRLLQAQPGTFFLIRSPGNFIPKYESLDTSVASGTPAALELACVNNNANTIVVLGHSDSKPLNMLFDMKDNLEEHESNNPSALKKWLILNGKDSVVKYKEFEKSGFNKCLTFSEGEPNQFDAYIDPDNQFSPQDKFTMINTLKQLKNVNNYNFLRDRITKKLLRGYALWTDITTNDVYMFSYKAKRFVKIDESTYNDLYKECDTINQ